MKVGFVSLSLLFCFCSVGCGQFGESPVTLKWMSDGKQKHALKQIVAFRVYVICFELQTHLLEGITHKKRVYCSLCDTNMPLGLLVEDTYRNKIPRRGKLFFSSEKCGS
jgi:hypothetical protein